MVDSIPGYCWSGVAFIYGMMGGNPAEAFELQLEEPAGSEGKN
jgi:hypothetical protein